MRCVEAHRMRGQDSRAWQQSRRSKVSVWVGKLFRPYGNSRGAAARPSISWA